MPDESRQWPSATGPSFQGDPTPICWPRCNGAIPTRPWSGTSPSAGAPGQKRRAKRQIEWLEGLLFQPGDPEQEAVEPGRRNPRGVAFASAEQLDAAHRQLHREQPLEVVAARDRSEPRPPHHRIEAPLPISDEMTVQLVVAGPQHRERRHGDQHAAVGFEQVTRVLQRGHRVRQVFEYVEHDDEPEPARRGEAGIEGTDVNPRPMAALGRYQALVRLDAPYLPDPGQLIEKQAVAASDIEDAAPPPWRPPSFDFPHQHRFAGTPPPMSLVEVPIGGRILRIQRCSSASPAAPRSTGASVDPRTT